VPQRIGALLGDEVPEVRAAAVYALGTFFGSSNRQHRSMERNLGTMLMKALEDASPIVRTELVCGPRACVHSAAVTAMMMSSWTSHGARALTAVAGVRIRPAHRAVPRRFPRGLSQVLPGVLVRARVSRSPFVPPLLTRLSASSVGDTSSEYTVYTPLPSSDDGVDSPTTSQTDFLWNVMMELSADSFPRVAEVATRVRERLARCDARRCRATVADHPARSSASIRRMLRPLRRQRRLATVPAARRPALPRPSRCPRWRWRSPPCRRS